MFGIIQSFLRDPKLYLYVLAGGFCALVDITLFLVIRHYVAVHYLVIATLTFFIATFLNYLLCQRVVFSHPTKRATQTKFMLTYLVSAIGLGIHHSILFFCVETLLLPLLIGKLVAMGIAFFWNFLSRKYLVFTAVS